jgi:hypothetical protein
METQIERAKLQHARTQAVIKDITGLTADEQNAMMFEKAYDWLESIGCKGDDQTMIASTRQFWGFWKCEWHRLDLLFINWWNHHDNTLDDVAMYEFYHNPENKFLQGAITHAGYHQLIKTIR